ncbi:M12 family metallo-peptidase [Pseudomarimonas arenosa]|uniref:Uncharacterized protein n=1 Tax=Pseudomarimonas arenosa TaxID=2774145 RepID=A0AAW3ZHL8_9GAMM|nr:M12 family metallo-peptidase [Pseudomarimonas arenosa]MBD8525034.1 hypothetical protein [Pseudomarimonas arenosa]
MSVLRARLLWAVFVGGMFAAAAVSADDWQELEAAAKKSVARPAALQSLPVEALQVFQRAGADKSSSAQILNIALQDGRRLTARSRSGSAKSGDGARSWGGVMDGADSRYQAVVTIGKEASFASLLSPQGRFEWMAQGDKGWLIDLGHPSFREPGFADDFMHDAMAHGHGQNEAGARLDRSPRSISRVGGKASTVIDVLFLYTQGFADRYPGSVAHTRIEHLMAVSNQGLANSRVDLALRLVGAEQVAYNDTDDNGIALENLRAAQSVSANVAGLQGVGERRNALGADLVILIRPHDIEVRGSCGIAFLFENRSDQGVNIVSDGFSGWSACPTSTFLHEVGHNLGAEHQNGANSPQAGFGTAYIAPSRFNTMMSSFGTGNPNRFLRLNTFSNPQIRCGGEACGVAGVADNARRVSNNMAAVAAYRAAVSAAPAPDFAAIDDDTDGDGLNDSEDAFPFDARWQTDRDRDGVADPVDAFPGDPNEFSDLDGDGIGDFQDSDRDGDGVVNVLDALPDDATDAVDSDQDRVGDSQDAFPFDRRESGDRDQDGIGDIADSDADGDGVNDLSDSAMDLLVVSAGNDRILRFEGDSGMFANIEVIGDFQPVAFGEYGRLIWDAPRKSLLALAEAGVMRYQRAPISQAQQLLYPSLSAGSPSLTGAFPSGFARDAQDRLYVSVTSNADLSRYDVIAGFALPAGQLNRPQLFAQPTRDVARTPDGRLWTLLRDGTLVEVNAENGSLGLQLPGTSVFNVPDAVDISAMIAGPDGALWFADRAGSRIWRLQPASGARASIVVAAGAGGLRQPGGLAFGPDGRLYVASTGSNQILRFDASAGQLIDVFSRVAPGVMLEPRALAFAPSIRDRYPRDAARQVRPVLGGWWNPQRSGHGLEVARVGDVLAVTWYTYSDDGKPTWYLAAAPFSGSVWQGELRSYRWDGSVATSEVVGSVQLSFSSDRAAEFSWSLPDSSGTERMQPLIVGNSSETQAPTAAWYPPTESGWGISFARQGEIGYALLFFYDSAGAPTWGLAAGAFDPQRMEFDLLQTFGPTRCPGCPGVEDPDNETIGSFRFDLQGSSQGRVSVSASAPGIDWQRSESEFVPLSDSPTDAAGRPRAFDGQ